MDPTTTTTTTTTKYYIAFFALKLDDEYMFSFKKGTVNSKNTDDFTKCVKQDIKSYERLGYKLNAYEPISIFMFEEKWQAVLNKKNLIKIFRDHCYTEPKLPHRFYDIEEAWKIYQKHKKNLCFCYSDYYHNIECDNRIRLFITKEKINMVIHNTSTSTSSLFSDIETKTKEKID